jgi:hypothetical protein
MPRLGRASGSGPFSGSAVECVIEVQPAGKQTRPRRHKGLVCFSPARCCVSPSSRETFIHQFTKYGPVPFSTFDVPCVRESRTCHGFRARGSGPFSGSAVECVIEVQPAGKQTRPRPGVPNPDTCNLRCARRRPGARQPPEIAAEVWRDFQHALRGERRHERELAERAAFRWLSGALWVSPRGPKWALPPVARSSLAPNHFSSGRLSRRT